MNATSPDPFDLARFVAAQASVYESVLAELTAGAKRSHWMWFIFPQVEGLGFSAMSRRYAIRSRQEAEAYLAHSLLGPRLAACAEALLAVTGKSARQIMGEPDDVKLQSSMTLFAAVAAPGSAFELVLQKYFSGARDRKTLDFLRE